MEEWILRNSGPVVLAMSVVICMVVLAFRSLGLVTPMYIAFFAGTLGCLAFLVWAEDENFIRHRRHRRRISMPISVLPPMRESGSWSSGRSKSKSWNRGR